MKQVFLIILIFSLAVRAGAQYFQSGEDPASIKWRQINTENFQLIYPDYYEKQAQKLATILEEVYDLGSYSINHKPKKISVILHTQTVQSNGLVAWAPKRAEFYTTPHQSIYPQDWLEQLAIHEFRHVVQIDKLNKNLPGIVKAILGEQGAALVFGTHLPWWFIEGDAVVAETAFSNFGRGRFPSFLMEHQAQVVENGIYSYDKAYFDSYRDFVPNHYRLGYYLVGGSRIKFGSDIWEPIITNAGKRPITFAPLNRILKEKTGFTKTQLYHSIFDSLQNVWIEKDQWYNSVEYEVVSPSKKVFTNYRYNHILDNSTVIVYKTSFNEIPAFVKIDESGDETKLFRPGVIFNESVNYRDDWIVWSEQIPDPRWAHSGKSLIRILDISTQKVTEINTQYKAFSPSISIDKSKVVVVEADFSNNYYLSVYQIDNGKLLERFQTGENNYFFSPDWISTNEVATVILTPKGKKLTSVNFQTKKLKVLVNKDLGDIKHVKVNDGSIYFISSYTGKDCLYNFRISENELFQLYEPRFGAESPAIADNQIVLSDYTADGFRTIKIKREDLVDIPFKVLEKGKYEMAELLSAQEPGIPEFSISDTIKYDSKKYNKTSHLFNFHSWAPVFINTATYKFLPGASILSQNKLGTAATALGYKWDIDEKAGQFYAAYTYKGWYPVFNFEISNGDRASKYNLVHPIQDSRGNIIGRDTALTRFTWGETRIGADSWLPLNFSKGSFNRYMQPELSYEYTFYKSHESTPAMFYEGSVHSLNYRLYYHQLLKRSYQDVFPDFGFVLDINRRHSPFGKTKLGNLTIFQSILYLPGLMKNHGIKLYGGYQTKEIGGDFGFSDAIRYPRGWGKISTTSMKSLAADYKFPLCFPDFSINGFLYLKRIDVSLFADYAYLEGDVYRNREVIGSFSKELTSYGSEVIFETNVLRFYAPANMGVRISYLPELNKTYFDFLFSINFTSL